MNIIIAIQLLLGLPLESVPPLINADPIEPTAAAVCVAPMCVFHPWAPLQPYTGSCPNLCTWYEKEPLICTDPTPNAWSCKPSVTASCWWDCDRIL